VVHSIIFLKRIGILVLVYFLCRVLFYSFNYHYLPGASPLLFLYGVRFDLMAIVFTNILFIVFSILPFKFRGNKYYQICLKLLFLVPNSIALLANCIDIAYFKYTLRRTTGDIFHLQGMGKDIFNLLPQFLADYYYIILIWIGLIWLMIKLYRKTEIVFLKENSSSVKYYALQILMMIVWVGAAIVAARGGTQGKPAEIITANRYANATLAPLVLNSPYTVLKTLERGSLVPNNYFDEATALTYFNPVKKPLYLTTMKPMNVVIIIMESFSYEYSGLSGNVSYTPFLDSIAKEALLFSNAYANTKSSVNGIPAILAGIPQLMNQPFISSSYGANKITSFATLLKDEGYHSSFFHGGNNGTMGFDDFISLAGFDLYYGRVEYEKDKKNKGADYDGLWGIYDDKFFKHYAQKLNQLPQPFFSSIFSLSSHHPYKIPEPFNSSIAEGSLNIHKSIRYADMALADLFENIKNTPWFDNTLFVITADHTGDPETSYYGNRVGMLRIPIVFYQPGSVSLKGENKKVIQQIDILPSVMHLLGYEKPYFCFGENVFEESEENYAVMAYGDLYQIINSEKALFFDGSEITAMYDLKQDSLLYNNLIHNGNNDDRLSNRLKSIIQQYNHSLINNSQTLRE
jgi:phosphoglycerol transferase MdoB-like AlkP superfamily enzyme